MFSYTVAVCLDDDFTRTFPAIDRSTASGNKFVSKFGNRTSILNLKSLKCDSLC